MKFVVLDTHGMGGARFVLDDSLELEAANPVAAAQQATGFTGPMHGRQLGKAPGCWHVEGQAQLHQLHDREGNPILRHPGTIGVIVVSR